MVQAQGIVTTFGVDWSHLLAQIASFCIVCFILYRFAYRPVLRTLSPQKDLAALEVVLWKGTYKRHRKLEDQAAPVQEKLNALSVLDGMRFLHNSPNAIEVLDEMRHSNYKFIGQMKHRIDLQWTIAVAEDYVNEKIAVSIYLGDLFNIAADHDPLVEIFKHVDREKEIFEHLQLDDLGKQDGKHYLLTIAASAAPDVAAKAYEIKDVAKIVDWIDVMGYDFHVPVTQVANLSAPLTQNPAASSKSLPA